MQTAVSLKRQLHKIVSGLTVIAVAYYSGSALYVVTEFRSSVAISVVLAAVFMIRVIVSLKGKLKINGSLYVLMATMIIINTILNPNDATFNIFVLSIITAGYAISIKYPIKSILKTIKISTLVFASTAIAGTILLNNTNLLDNLPEYVSNNGWKYRIGYIYNYLPVVKERVFGFFWEPGILSSYLSIGLVTYICTLKNRLSLKSIAYIAIILNAIFISTSTAGYVLAILCITLLFVREMNKKSVATEALRFGILIGIIIGLLFVEPIIEVIGMADDPYVSKLMFQNLSTSSRYIAIEKNLTGWLQSPIFGLGLTAVQVSGPYYDVSTSTYLMTVFGVGGVFYTVALIYGVLRRKSLNSYMKLIIVAILMIIINKEPHFYNLATWVYIFALLKTEKTNGME